MTDGDAGLAAGTRHVIGEDAQRGLAGSSRRSGGHVGDTLLLWPELRKKDVMSSGLNGLVPVGTTSTV